MDLAQKVLNILHDTISFFINIKHWKQQNLKINSFKMNLNIGL